MYDIITIGSAITDIFVQSSQFTIQTDNSAPLLCQLYGDKLEADLFSIQTGGGGGNTAVGFARLGYHVAVVTEIGADTLAKIIDDNFHQEKVATNLIVKEKKEQTGAAVILIGSDGGRSVVVHRGAASLLDPSDIPAERLSQAQWVHLSSINGRLETLKTIFANITKQKLSWNPGKKELELLANGHLSLSNLSCGVLFVNKEEWAIIEAIQSYILATIPEVVVTNGAKGGTVYAGGKPLYEYAAVPNHSVDDTGAGDAFAVGYTAARLRKLSIEQACDRGSKNAASVVQHIGAKKGLLEELFFNF